MTEFLTNKYYPPVDVGTAEENMEEITQECYARVKALYVEREFLLYEFPIYAIPEVDIGCGVTYRGFYWRKMDVVLPPELDDSIWSYVNYV